MLSFTQKLSLVTVVFLSLIKCMNCDCGRPGIPLSGFITTEIKSRFPENLTIEYKCRAGQTLVYNSSRIYRERKWMGRVP